MVQNTSYFNCFKIFIVLKFRLLVELCGEGEGVLEAADPRDEAALLSAGGVPRIPGTEGILVPTANARVE
jgi:hypothetical protein